MEKHKFYSRKIIPKSSQSSVRPVTNSKQQFLKASKAWQTKYSSVRSPNNSINHQQIKKRGKKLKKIIQNPPKIHATEIFQRQKQNKRIICRILNPKRDKTILHSLQRVKKHGYNSLHSTKSQGKRSLKQKQKDLNDFYKQSHQIQRMKNKYHQEYQLKVQNQRMGNRIVNTKSALSFYDKKLVKQNQAMNQGVKAFFQQKQNPKRNYQKYSFSIAGKKNYYGYGPTIIAITDLHIESHPKLHPQQLISLQLLIQNSSKKQYQTKGIPYEILKNFGVKFAVRMKSIGEYVPLRIQKFNGVQNIEIGIIDLNLGNYLHNLQQNIDFDQNQLENRMSQDQQSRTYQFNKTGKVRLLVKQQVSSRLRKTKTNDSHDKAKVGYMIYSKKYA